MALEQEAATSRRLLPDPPDDVRATRRYVLHLDDEPLAPEPRLDEGGDLGLVGLGIAGVIHAGNPHQRAGELRDFVRVDGGEELRQRGHSGGGATPAGTRE